MTTKKELTVKIESAVISKVEELVEIVKNRMDMMNFDEFKRQHTFILNEVRLCLNNSRLLENQLRSLEDKLENMLDITFENFE